MGELALIEQIRLGIGPPEGACAAGDWRRLRDSAAAGRLRDAGDDRLYAGRTALSAGSASAGVGGAPLPGARVERPGGDGGRSAGGVPVAGAAGGDAADARDGVGLRGSFAGLRGLGDRYGVPLAGGDTAESLAGMVLADIVLVGSAPAGKALRRSGGRAGRCAVLHGALGGCGGGVGEMSAGTAAEAGGRLRAERTIRSCFRSLGWRWARLCCGGGWLRRVST